MRRSSAAASDGQIDRGRVRKPCISRQKPVTWPDAGFGHLTGYVFVGQTWPRPSASAGGLGSADQTGHALAGGVGQPRHGLVRWRAGVGKDRAGQRRTKRALVRQERCLLWRAPAAKGGQRRSYTDKSRCSVRLFAKTAKRIGGVPWTRADKMERRGQRAAPLPSATLTPAVPRSASW